VRILVLIGMLVALLFASFNLYSFDHMTRVTGLVTAISADSITIDAAEDNRESVTIEVLGSTLFVQDGQTASWRDLRIGAQADVDATINDHALYAINVVFAKPPARGHTRSSPAQQSRSYDAYLRRSHCLEPKTDWLAG
jgi:hypothetical protein